MGSSLFDLRRLLNRRISERDVFRRQISELESKLQSIETHALTIKKSQVIARLVSETTQNNLTIQISDLVGTALEAIFPDPYTLDLSFESRRGKTEVDISFLRGEEEMKLDPMDSTGGGPVDVAAFALRIALWSLQSPRSRPVLVLDEPFRFVSRDLQEKAAELLKELSDKLGIQIILVTHENSIIDQVDQVVEVRIRKGRSGVVGE